MSKHFIATLSLLSLLATPVASFAKPAFTPPGQLKVKVKNEVVVTTNSSTTPTSTPPNTTSTPPATTTPKAPKEKATSTKAFFTLTGEIVSVNASSSLLEVKVKTASHRNLKKMFQKKSIMLKVDQSTAIRLPGNKNATLADLSAGQRVTVKGKIDGEMYVATSIVAAGKPGKAKGILNSLFNKVKKNK